MGITAHYDPQQVPSRIHAAVGRVASAWAGYEHDLDFAICCFLGRGVLGPQQERNCLCVLTQMLGATPRLKAIIALHQELPERKKKIHDSLVKLLQTNYKVQDKRNRAVHDVWYYELIKGKTVRREIVTSKRHSNLKTQI